MRCLIVFTAVLALALLGSAGIANAALDISTPVVGSEVTVSVGTTGELSLTGTGTGAASYNVLTMSTVVPNNTGPVIEMKKNPSSYCTANNELGTIKFLGSYSGGATSEQARIQATCPLAWGTTTRASQLTFWTTARHSTDMKERVRITKDGLVGIGTTDPSAQLQVTLPAGKSYPALELNAWSANPASILTLTSANGELLRIGAKSPGDVYIETLGGKDINFVCNRTGAKAGQMVIKWDGNVGIGTYDPAAKLDVDGDIWAVDYTTPFDLNNDGDYVDEGEDAVSLLYLIDLANTGGLADVIDLEARVAAIEAALRAPGASGVAKFK